MNGHQLMKLFLILNALYSRPVRADGPSPAVLLPKCQSALSACDILVNRQADQIKTLEKALDAPAPAPIPGWVWGVLGVGLGVAVGVGLKR